MFDCDKLMRCPDCSYEGQWQRFRAQTSLFKLPFRCPSCGKYLFRVWNWKAPLAYIVLVTGLLVLWEVRTVYQIPVDVLWVLGFHAFYVHFEGALIQDLRLARKGRRLFHTVLKAVLVVVGAALLIASFVLLAPTLS